MHMLDYEAPGLAAKIQALSLDERRRRLSRAAASAARLVENVESEVQEILNQAVTVNQLSPEQVADIKRYADAADKRCFELQEQQAAQVLSGNWFSKARLAMAIASLFGGTSWQDAADAAYELCFVCEDKPMATAILRSEIDRVTIAG